MLSKEDYIKAVVSFDYDYPSINTPSGRNYDGYRPMFSERAYSNGLIQIAYDFDSAYQHLFENGIDGDMARAVFKTIDITKPYHHSLERVVDNFKNTPYLQPIKPDAWANMGIIASVFILYHPKLRAEVMKKKSIRRLIEKENQKRTEMLASDTKYTTGSDSFEYHLAKSIFEQGVPSFLYQHITHYF
jgi:hypothetical protein